MNSHHDIVPIVFAANDYFAPYMAVAIQSIMENAASSGEYRLFILHVNITPDTIKLLNNQVSKFSNFSITYINVSEHILQYNFFTENRPDLTKEAYFRLLIPELFLDYEKVIYLDGDMICCCDIVELFNMKIGNNLLGAARDISDINRFLHNGKYAGNKYWDVKSHMKNPTDYFSDGMLLINIHLFRNTISIKDLLNLAVSRKWKYHDQDILNHIAVNKVFFLPYSWNFIETENADNLPEYLKNEYYEAESAVKIIHFAGILEKPWLMPFNVRYFHLFWKYATRTPFIDLIILRMHEKNLIDGRMYQDYVVNAIKQGNCGPGFILRCLKAWVTKITPPPAKISVIVPVYNSALFLEDCLDSILCQHLPILNVFLLTIVQQIKVPIYAMNMRKMTSE